MFSHENDETSRFPSNYCTESPRIDFPYFGIDGIIQNGSEIVFDPNIPNPEIGIASCCTGYTFI